jgi:hypothetical protein
VVLHGGQATQDIGQVFLRIDDAAAATPNDGMVEHRFRLFEEKECKAPTPLFTGANSPPQKCTSTIAGLSRAKSPSPREKTHATRHNPAPGIEPVMPGAA